MAGQGDDILIEAQATNTTPFRFGPGRVTDILLGPAEG